MLFLVCNEQPIQLHQHVQGMNFGFDDQRTKVISLALCLQNQWRLLVFVYLIGWLPDLLVTCFWLLFFFFRKSTSVLHNYTHMRTSFV